MAEETTIVWVCCWLEGGVTHHRYYDQPGPAETQAAGIKARLPGCVPLVYAMTIWNDLEETA
jgi:hypothetical protein